jgi:hypothetical protein
MLAEFGANAEHIRHMAEYCQSQAVHGESKAATLEMAQGYTVDALTTAYQHIAHITQSMTAAFDQQDKELVNLDLEARQLAQAR